MPTISILTYNILSQKLADLMVNEIKDGKKVYDNSFMNESYRWNKISNLIETRIIESISKSDKSIDPDYLIFCLNNKIDIPFQSRDLESLSTFRDD